MTSRLKRKLNDLGVDPSSSKANESFCLIGTPLPPLEKSKDTGEFVPLWKQEVRDEKGRRRLHGAFTGGFSAGYFNTVGSKEGWAPSTFVSSRSDRAKKNQAKPEDFMDDEDLAEVRESRQLVDENEEMDFGATEAELRRRAGPSTEDDPMANALAALLAPPASDSVGARILRKMGWRLGQGIGPRITYDQRRAQDRTVGVLTDEEDEEAKKHMFPRRDTPLLLVARKDNSHGLGYTPGMGLNETLGRGAESKGPRLSSGFGLGALNDADEDDLDVYDAALGSERSKRILAYDAADEDEQIAMGSSRRRRTDNSVSLKSGVTQTFGDGRPVLKGFVLSDQPIAEDRWFPLSEVPSGWKPNPRRVWNASVNKENETVSKGIQQDESPRTHGEWKRSLLSADERGSILGETPLPPQPRSVFDYMSHKDKDRLESIVNNLTVGPTESPGAGPSVPPSAQRAEIEIPHVHPSIAKAALQGFQPFATDPVKHSRYTAFLNHASNVPGAPLDIGPLPDQKTEQFNRELADYAKAATVFKPLSGAMASRFKSATILETGPKIIEGLHTPDLSALETEDQAVEEEKEEDPRMAAVKLGMYGPLTREVTPWQPVGLLCKRFGVKDPGVKPSTAEPEPAGRGAGAPEAGDTGAMAAPPLAITDGSAATPPADTSQVDSKGRRNLANIGLGEDDEQGKDTLTYQRPAMDVFKAIFASDDEDSDAEDEDADVDQQTAEASAPSSLHPESAPPQPFVVGSTQTSYEPNVLSSSVEESDQKVDLATFKPTFVPRSDREARKDTEKGKGRDKKKKKAAALVSFDDEDEGLRINVNSKKRKDKDKDGERKKKKRKERKDMGDDDSMWVEKPAPEVVHNMVLDDSTPSASLPEANLEGVAGPPRGRKRAVDFM